jgi:hypothetical protein
LEQREKLNKHWKQQNTSVLLGTPENWLGLARAQDSGRAARPRARVGQWRSSRRRACFSEAHEAETVLAWLEPRENPF